MDPTPPLSPRRLVDDDRRGGRNGVADRLEEGQEVGRSVLRSGLLESPRAEASLARRVEGRVPVPRER